MQNEGLAPLHISAGEGDEAMIKYLYSNKVNPNTCDIVSFLSVSEQLFVYILMNPRASVYHSLFLNSNSLTFQTLENKIGRASCRERV